MRKSLIVASLVSLMAVPALAQPMMQNGNQGYGMGSAMMGPGMMGNCPMGGMGMMGQGNPHTEGRIAFLKAELKITDAQEKSWAAYADVMRAVAKRGAGQMGMMGSGMGPGMGPGMMGSGPMGPGMMQQGSGLSAPEALQNRVEFAEGHLKTLKELQAATKKLYRDLDDTQKKTADDLLGAGGGMGMRGAH